MKKIIAMLLCVAMVAAFGINAFAAVKSVGITNPTVSTVQELLDARNAGDADLPKTYLNAYAKTLNDMNKELAKAKKIYAAAVKDVKDSYAVAQAYLLTAAYESAWADLQIETTKAINGAIADALYEMGWVTAPTFTWDVAVLPAE